MILDGAEIARSTLVDGVSDPRSLLLAMYPDATIPPLDHVVRTAEPLAAQVNHGTWIAPCSCGARTGLPAPGCVVFLDMLLEWCVRCGNQAWGGGWRQIVAPAPDERRKIEAVLLCRPNVGDRNWEPHEAVADLIAQNREHGDPVPSDDEPPAPVAPAPSPSRFPPTAAMAAVLGHHGRRRRR